MFGGVFGRGGDDVRFSKSRAFAASKSMVSSSPSLAAVAAVAKKKGTPVKGQACAKEEEDADKDKAGLHDVLRGCRWVVVIGVYGWCPGAMIRSVLGEVSVFFLLSIFPDLVADWVMLVLFIIICATCLIE
jgi:hypothetical protein